MKLILSVSKNGIGKINEGRAVNTIPSIWVLWSGSFGESGPGKILQFLNRVHTINAKELGSVSSRRNSAMIGCE
ncbi:hypothetical protein PITC_078790 [Penicillium italicum]|uniref:Uncharacterized protein n=1 Tax=Penicillium italicum TaxID=40296 RepID=A0A0A2KQ13_PENIT|nr:hypothetical protein PITC_078790 [Penicillium italicum]